MFQVRETEPAHHEKKTLLLTPVMDADQRIRSCFASSICMTLWLHGIEFMHISLAKFRHLHPVRLWSLSVSPQSFKFKVSPSAVLPVVFALTFFSESFS